MTSELKPCPFCGGDAEYYTDNGPTGEVYGWVGCNQCDAMSCHIDVRSMQPEEAHPIDAWNTRAEQAAELAKFKALAETLAGALGEIAQPDYGYTDILERGCPPEKHIDYFCSMVTWRQRTAREALTSYKEARDD